MKTLKISILVILFNKKIEHSATIQSLLSVNEMVAPDITIVNNGPNPLKNIELFMQENNSKFGAITFIEYLENRSLSKIYNEFIERQKSSDYLVIFDDDSIFEPGLIEHISGCNADLIVPLIKSSNDGEFYYPTYNGKVQRVECSLQADKLMSIASGLILNAGLIKVMSRHFNSVFDESFALYGIDTSFFLRLQQCSKYNDLKIVCQGTINHSLSRTDSKPLVGFRLRERLCDAALIARHYPNRERMIYFCKKIIQNTYRLQLSNLHLLLKCYLTGKHPRG